jgi:hypothetical protein
LPARRSYAPAATRVWRLDRLGCSLGHLLEAIPFSGLLLFSQSSIPDRRATFRRLIAKIESARSVFRLVLIL